MLTRRSSVKVRWQKVPSRVTGNINIMEWKQLYIKSLMWEYIDTNHLTNVLYGTLVSFRPIFSMHTCTTQTAQQSRRIMNKLHRQNAGPSKAFSPHISSFRGTKQHSNCSKWGLLITPESLGAELAQPLCLHLQLKKQNSNIAIKHYNNKREKISRWGKTATTVF